MCKKLMKFQKNAFTLAEALITLSIIGIIAAITIPSMINNHKANINRTRLKKASEVYSNVILMMTSENNIKANVNSLDDWGSKNDCDNVRQYFKIVQTGGTGCQFKTSDGVWWSFGKDSTGKENGTLSKPIIAFKMGDLATAKAGADNNYDAFYFVTQFDANKKVRVLDLNFGNDRELNSYKSKVYAFINKKSVNDYMLAGNINNNNINNNNNDDAEINNEDMHINEQESENTPNEQNEQETQEEPLTGFAKCFAENKQECQLTDSGPIYKKITPNTKKCAKNSSSTSLSDEELCVDKPYYIMTSAVNSDQYYTSNTSSSTKKDYWAAAKSYCLQQGGELATLGQLYAAGYITLYAWSANDAPPNHAYTLFNGKTVGSDLKIQPFYSAICVGVNK